MVCACEAQTPWLLATKTGSKPSDGSVRIYITDTSTTNWTVPANWNNSSNKIEAIGGGAGGRFGTPTSNLGGGGGAYAYTNNVTLTPGASVGVHVGSGGASGGDGGDSYICNITTGCADITGASVVVGAEGDAF